jgi:hypothetical protein
MSSHSYYLSKTYFNNNTYYGNLASNRYGVLHLQNLYRLEFVGETFSRNGDSFCLVLKAMFNKKIIKYFNTFTSNACTLIDMYTVLTSGSTVCSGDTCLNGKTSRGVVYAKNSHQLTMTNVAFTDTMPIEYKGFDNDKA